ncbi:MAG: hypothetical protein GW872_04670 [Nitrospirae bacterium]|nr:hypothetical protein [Nitrospirota bacterium]OIO28286.1 MAG: hypothetical protein AUJ60_07455 [Nitrospirae bacterium CG1_02_44_142]
MTGERTFQKFKRLISKKAFLLWLDSLKKDYKLIGPRYYRGNQAVFKEVDSSKELFMEYESAMLSPGKLFLYKPQEELFRFTFNETSNPPSPPFSKRGMGGFSSKKITVDEIKPDMAKQVIVGVHPCDVNAILYLDRTFLGAFKDPHYEARRKNTLIISLNCTHVGGNCFCSSVGAGPFLHSVGGYDVLLTDFESEYLVEIKSREAEELFGLEGRGAGRDEMRFKAEKEKAMQGKFRKTLNVSGLDNIFAENMEHPVWQQTAEEKCLSCSNCVMVCPTCFCYDLRDEMSMNLKTVTRYRCFDACLDIRFAEVHGGNFRQSRAARLRQFVAHKLDQTNQYGVFGTVGCGRCITWCPTGIDLTEIAEELRTKN